MDRCILDFWLHVKIPEHFRRFGEECDALLNKFRFFCEFFIVCSCRELFADKWKDAIHKISKRNFAHPLALQPVEFFGIEDCARFLHPIQTERFQKFRHRKHFLFRARVPTKKCQKVKECFGQISFLLIMFSCNIVLALAQLAAVLIQKKWHVCILWRIPAQKAEEE
jgi:hypothetical protein